MSGGGGGPVIIGDKPLIDQIEAHMDKIANFRRKEAQDIITLYRHNERAVTREQQEFLLRCASDILDNV